MAGRSVFSKTIICCVAAFVICSSVEAGRIPVQIPGALSGKPFTDPNKQVDMPEEWLKQPLEYDSWAKDADIAVTLGQDLYPTFFPIIQDYAKRNNITIAVKEGTCGISAGLLKRKRVDMGGFCCPPSRTDRLPGLKFHTLGIGPIGLLVHPDNPVDNVSLDEARNIFQGKMHRWSELEAAKGGKALKSPIKVIGRLHCKPRPGHWRLLLDNESRFSARMLEVEATLDMISRVAAFKGAIGYETLWSVSRYRDRGKVKVLKIGGHDPADHNNLANGKYALYRVYNVTTWETQANKNPHAGKLIKYLIGQIERLHEEAGLVPVSKLKDSGWKFKDNELVGEPE